MRIELTLKTEFVSVPPVKYGHQRQSPHMKQTMRFRRRSTAPNNGPGS